MGSIIQTDIKEEIPSLPGILVIGVPHLHIDDIGHRSVRGEIPVHPGHLQAGILQFRQQDPADRFLLPENAPGQTFGYQHAARLVESLPASLHQLE